MLFIDGLLYERIEMVVKAVVHFRVEKSLNLVGNTKKKNTNGKYLLGKSAVICRLIEKIHFINKLE